MTIKGRGQRKSVWPFIQRCLAILRRVQQGLVQKSELLIAVCGPVGEDAYGGSAGTALAKKFDGDKRCLRQPFGTKVRYDGSTGGNVITDHGRPPLNLPDAHLSTLAFLADTFAPASPLGRQLQEPINTLTAWLSDERREAHRRARVTPRCRLRLRDEEPITADVWQKILEAHNRRRQRRFDYLSSSHNDSLPRQHIVELQGTLGLPSRKGTNQAHTADARTK